MHCHPIFITKSRDWRTSVQKIPFVMPSDTHVSRRFFAVMKDRANLDAQHKTPHRARPSHGDA